jgi:hypothetical protein
MEPRCRISFRLAVCLLCILPTIGIAQDQPPRDVPVIEKKWEELANKEVSEYGAKALAIEPKKWKHAETENFILHFRRMTEAKKVAREIEFNIWFVAKTLNAGKERYQRKSHVYVFEDEEEWKAFIPQTGAPQWSVSFARGDELFLDVRRTGESGRFKSDTLAHEATHAVVARLYPRQRWPLWLSEGFAEYMGTASIAARRNQPVRGRQAELPLANLSLGELMAMEVYPSDQAMIGRLYQSSEKLVRFLMDELPKERFPQFVDVILSGKTLEPAIMEVYGDKVKDFPTFTKKFEKFLN